MFVSLNRSLHRTMEIMRTHTFAQLSKYVILLVLICECVKGDGDCEDMKPEEICEEFCEKLKCTENCCKKCCSYLQPKDRKCNQICKKLKPKDSDCQKICKTIKDKDRVCKKICKKGRSKDDCCENYCQPKETLTSDKCEAFVQNLTTTCNLQAKNIKNKLQRRCIRATANCEASDKDSITQIHSRYKAYCRKLTNSSFKGITLVANSSWVGERTTQEQNVDIEVVLPEELFRKSMEQQNDFSSITFSLFNDTALFEDEKNSTILNNNVIEVAVGNTSIHNLTEYVNITINHKSKMLNNFSQHCVFWSENEDDNSTGHWDSTGCKTTVQDGHTICQCDHLSYFAVLLDFSNTNNTVDEKVLISLMYISQIGCGISAIFSATTIIIYCVFRKIKSDQVTKIHMNLCAAIFLLNVNFLTNVWLSMVKNESLCKTIAVFLHYSLLCTFTWMGIEAFQLYLLLIKVFNTYIKYYIQKLAVIGWGLPAIVVLICIAIPDIYGEFVIEKQDGKNTSMCWIKEKVVHYITNCGYFSIIFFGNTIILITVCTKLFYLKRQRTEEQGSVWKDLWTILGLCCLLGITWALAFFSFGPLRLVEIYLFTIFNSLQGFFIFLWYWAMKKPTKDEISSYTTST
ncbi:adhesion G-protein coupled receptor G5-like isoform X1 [Chiloscyllium plagiosum]|uniref:adhesion G-protein coupled receptor G5-like isoform X1 n=2 Tax=Chiloscyllium plagiosum TaxID=36176 RepID=UPI001CB7C402|nr:adhesion G-protein coupled receptor G5-like isoform X1 [Chiloscyllium plagiosum]